MKYSHLPNILLCFLFPGLEFHHILDIQGMALLLLLFPCFLFPHHILDIQGMVLWPLLVLLTKSAV